MAATIRRLVILHRAALGRWRKNADRRHAIVERPGSLDRAAWLGCTNRMERQDILMMALQRRMQALHDV